MQKEYLTPAAILLGSTIIGAGLFFGLQQRAPAPPPPPAPPAPTRPAPAPVSPPPAAAPAVPPAGGAAMGLGPPPVSAELREKVAQDVRKALEDSRAELVRSCWEPSFKKAADPPRAKYIYNVSFDPSGKQIARGISEVRGMERPDAAQCLRSRPMDLQIPAPGAYVGVEVELTLP